MAKDFKKAVIDKEIANVKMIFAIEKMDMSPEVEAAGKRILDGETSVDEELDKIIIRDKKDDVSD